VGIDGPDDRLDGLEVIGEFYGGRRSQLGVRIRRTLFVLLSQLSFPAGEFFERGRVARHMASWLAEGFKLLVGDKGLEEPECGPKKNQKRAVGSEHQLLHGGRIGLSQRVLSAQGEQLPRQFPFHLQPQVFRTELHIGQEIGPIQNAARLANVEQFDGKGIE